MTETVVNHCCEVLVIGSGVSGYCAAIQAGRLGCRTILLEKDEVLGGNGGPNLGVGITGADRYSPFATETGVIHELHEKAGWIDAFTQTSAGSMPYNISRRFEALVQEFVAAAGVTVLKRHFAREPVLGDGGRIAAVICQDLASFQLVRIDVEHVVIEGSGDGEVGALAGADYDIGSEAKSEFGERSAPEERNDLVQGTSLVAIAQRIDHEVAFVAPPDLPPFVPRVWQAGIGSFVKHHTGWFHDRKDLFFLYITETGGERDTILDDGEIYETLLGQLWSEWDHIKNGPHRDEARCWDLLWVSPKAGKRESRRFLGDVILTQTDVEDGRFFPDDIAWSGHDLDDHRPLGDGGDIFAHSVPPLHGIPLRACYSRNTPNLLLAGRLISATHLAHSATRVMRTGGAIGQGVGHAAALCCRHQCTPKEVADKHLDELLRGLFETDASIPAKAFRLPNDIAPDAAITATTEMCFNDQEIGSSVPLIARAGVMLWDWPAELQQFECRLRNTTAEPQALTLRFYRASNEPKWTSKDDYDAYRRNDLRDSAFAEIATLTTELPAAHDGWFPLLAEPVALGQKNCTRDDDRVLLALDENPAVEWALAARQCEIAALVEHSHHSPQWRALAAMAAVRLDPPPALGEAVNAVNGFKQRFSRGPANLWISDPAAALPQGLLLSWSQPRTFDEVCVVFDNLTEQRHDYPWEGGPRVLPMLAAAYEIDCAQGDEWQRLASETCNIHRFRRHRFAPVTADKLRLRVLRAHGEGNGARVYELRVMTTA